MALVDLPETPGPAALTMRALDFGVVRTPPLGGRAQRINRSGNRWAVDVTLPPLPLADARRWSAALTSALQNGARWKLRQVGLHIGPLATVLVAGAGQLGTALNVDGGASGAPWGAGQFVSLLTGGARYLHQMAGAGVFSSSGTAALVLAEPLRVVPADNAPVEFAPQIEGLVEADAAALTIDAARLGRMAFSIAELG